MIKFENKLKIINDIERWLKFKREERQKAKKRMYGEDNKRKLVNQKIGTNPIMNIGKSVKDVKRCGKDI